MHTSQRVNIKSEYGGVIMDVICFSLFNFVTNNLRDTSVWSFIPPKQPLYTDVSNGHCPVGCCLPAKAPLIAMSPRGNQWSWGGVSK